MLKKIGVLAAVVAAGVIGVSTFAFADTNSETGNLTNDCSASQAGSLVDQDLTGGSSLLGLVDPVTGAVAPVDTQTQAANCTNVNVSDVLDSESNNTDVSRTRTEVEDSYNSSTDVELDD